MVTILSRFLFGEIRYRLRTPPAKGANLFLYSGIPCFNGCSKGEEFYDVSIEPADKRALSRLLLAKGVDYEILYEQGLFPFLLKAALRPGLVAGLALALFFVSRVLPIEDQWLRMGANTLLLALFVAYIVKRDLPLKQIPIIGKFFR